MISRVKPLFFIFLSVQIISAQATFETLNLQTPSAESFFIENKGQWPEEVHFLARIGGLNAWITSCGVTYDTYRIVPDASLKEYVKKPLHGSENSNLENAGVIGHVVKFNHLEVNQDAHVVAHDRRHGYYNYFIGNDYARWANFVRLYNQVELRNIYEGIDVRYYFDQGLLRYDYIVAPDADIAQIVFSVEGADDLDINSNGELKIQTHLGEVRHGKIYAFQVTDGKQEEVPCRYTLMENGLVGLQVDDYDKENTLIIDPLVYSTFIGGTSWDPATAIAVDNDNNAYVTGWTWSSDFPTTPGSYNENLNAYFDVYVTKLNSTGSDLIYSTFIGGSFGEQPWSIKVDEEGNVYVGGSTWSPNYPTTPNAFDVTFNGKYIGQVRDIFVTKLNPSGSDLIYSTFVGGTFDDVLSSIVIDKEGTVYFTGYTESSNFPTTPGAFDREFNGVTIDFTPYDVYVGKLSPDGSELQYSTFLGGASWDRGNSIAIDDGGNMYITGETRSETFPTTPGAFDEEFNGISTGYWPNENVFVTKINAAGSDLIYSTFMGGEGTNVGTSIAVNPEGNVYVTGYTYSLDFPTTPGAYKENYSGWAAIFVTKFNEDGSDLIYSTYIGNTLDQYPRSLAIDTEGNVYLTGRTNSRNFPTTPDAYSNNFGGRWDVFLLKLNANFSELIYSTYIGGPFWDEARSIVLDKSRNVYITGWTHSEDYPTTSGSYIENFIGIPNTSENSNAFVTKIKYTLSSVRQVSGELPVEYYLSQNYPNPFNPTTTIRYGIPTPSYVKLEIYNMLGQRVEVLMDGYQEAGTYQVQWSPNFASGTYLYRLEAVASSDPEIRFVKTKRMVYLR